jgi:hypothetical protein
VTAGGVSQTIPLSGHDTIATVSVSTITPALNPATPNTVATTGTITVTNTSTICLAAVQTGCPNGSNIDAGPYIPTAITLTQASGTGTFALGGTCAVGTPINPGVASVPPTANGSCTITITYTPPVGATATTPGLAGSAHLTVTGYGLDPTQTFINATYPAN